MSIRIKLFFESTPDLELLGKNVHVDIVRVLCKVQFLGEDAWNIPEIAIVDSGAPLSVIPADIWKESKINVLAKTVIRGMIPKKECAMEVDVGEISIRLLDNENISLPMKIKAYFAPTNRIPIIVGIDSLLVSSDVFFNTSRNEGYIEIS